LSFQDAGLDDGYGVPQRSGAHQTSPAQYFCNILRRDLRFKERACCCQIFTQAIWNGYWKQKAGFLWASSGNMPGRQHSFVRFFDARDLDLSGAR
jgi:hypothetical protein